MSTPAGAQARAVLRSHRSGVLSTLSLRLPGHPFGAAVPHATDGRGRPLLLLSHLAEHRQNLEADARAGFLVSAHGPDLHAQPRASLVGEAVPVPAAEAAGRYLALFPEHRRYLEIGGFAFFRIEPRQVRLIAGFGAQHWIDAVDYLLPASDLDDAEAGILEHMNADHADALRDLLRHHHGIDAAAVRLCAFDADGFDLAWDGGCLRVAFDAPLTALSQVRGQLAGMARAARGR